MMLSNREKLLLVLLGTALAVVLLYFGVKGLRGYEAELSHRITQQEAMLARVEALEDELSRLNVEPRARGRNQPLISYVEQLAARNRLRDRVQLNLLSRRGDKNLEGIEIKVADMTLDEMVNFIHALENDRAGFVIEHLELTPAFRTKNRLRLLVRVLAYKS